MSSLPAQPRSTASSVCIIGAGPSGLAVAKYLIAEDVFSRITIFEQRDKVGGIWNHVPCPIDASKDIAVPQLNHTLGHDMPVWSKDLQDSADASRRVDDDDDEPLFMSPLYDRLETNIPRSLMGFSDLDWPEDCQLFPRHESALSYIDRYAEEVRHLIEFRTQVRDVSLNDEGRWLVVTQPVTREGDTANPTVQTFDAMIVASGHYNVPYIPAVDGIEQWHRTYPGSITHSKFYRRPEDFAGKKVLVVGNSASGIDIGSQIATTCQRPLLMSQKSESYLSLGPSRDKVEKPEVVEYIPQDRRVRFADGSLEDSVDAIIFCTGYFYSFPFLDSIKPALITNGECVHGLYQHLFYRHQPTLAFPVINQKVIPFPVAEAQGAVIARVLAGRLKLPSEEEMAEWEEQVKEEMGDGRKFHVLQFPKDAEYINMLHNWAMSADREGASSASTVGNERHKGKTPPYWNEKEYWTRERFPAIKQAFQGYGEERYTKRTLEDVGFDFARRSRGEWELVRTAIVYLQQ